jgi:hypothetical protein
MTIDYSDVLQVVLIAFVASLVLSSAICLTMPKPKKA